MACSCRALSIVAPGIGRPSTSAARSAAACASPSTPGYRHGSLEIRLDDRAVAAVDLLACPCGEIVVPLSTGDRARPFTAIETVCAARSMTTAASTSGWPAASSP